MMRRTPIETGVPAMAADAAIPRPRAGQHRWVWIGGIVVLAGVAVGGVVALSGGVRPSSAPTVTAESTGQDLNVTGGALPPGVPTVTAKRINATTLRFTWTYGEPLPSDQFRWQIPDGTRSGVSSTARVDIADPSGTQLCIEVKVVRASGDSAAVDWSPAGCGS